MASFTIAGAAVSVMVGTFWSLQSFKAPFVGAAHVFLPKTRSPSWPGGLRESFLASLAYVMWAPYYKTQVRGRGIGRKPRDLIVRRGGEAARLQLDSEFF